jgi:hypothetical protein
MIGVTSHVVRQSDLIMTPYFIHTKVKRVYGHEGDLSVRCVPGRGADNEDVRWLMESAAQVLLYYFIYIFIVSFPSLKHIPYHKPLRKYILSVKLGHKTLNYAPSCFVINLVPIIQISHLLNLALFSLYTTVHSITFKIAYHSFKKLSVRAMYHF